jgi:hypothetical protein
MLASAAAASPSETETKRSAILQQYEKHKRQMELWTVTEDCIIIKCRSYVAIVVSIAGIIICGCFAVPFVVKQDISGVDPFQIFMFAWVLAGFIVIVAKSRYVSEWPWHHFIRGEVVCGSVRDVSEVTGIDKQAVLSYLLHGERTNILTTRGPYNGMFGRTTEGSGGFSIDVPVQLSTMLASGFIVLKVVNTMGEHLICEDVRMGAPARAIMGSPAREYVSYMDLGKDALENELQEADGTKEENSQEKSQEKSLASIRIETSPEKVQRLTVNEFAWKKVAGLYIRDAKFG